MSNWIKERADDVRRIEKEKKEEYERKTVAASDLKALTGPFWKELVGVLNQSVKDFNDEFPEAGRRIDHFERPDADTFTIRRAAFPAVGIKVQLNSAGTMAQYLISRTQRKGINTVEKQASFSYTIADGQVAYAEPGLRSHDDVARLLLESFFEF